MEDSKLKGGLLHLILSNINPKELEHCEALVYNKEDVTTKQDYLYRLLGQIIEKIKR